MCSVGCVKLAQSIGFCGVAPSGVKVPEGLKKALIVRRIASHVSNASNVTIVNAGAES